MSKHTEECTHCGKTFRNLKLHQKAEPPVERFFKYVDAEDDTTSCWNWIGNMTKYNYGQFYDGKTHVPSYRFSYELYKGKIPEGKDVDHLCRNRLCVNPDHLEAVTRRENLLRSSNFISRNIRATHCPKGHPYSGDNLYLHPKNGSRDCRTCRGIKFPGEKGSAI